MALQRGKEGERRGEWEREKMVQDLLHVTIWGGSICHIYHRSTRIGLFLILPNVMNIIGFASNVIHPHTCLSCRRVQI